MNDFMKSLPSSWKGIENDIWLTSSFRLYRNIDKFKFPSKQESEKRRQVSDLIKSSVLTLSSLEDPQGFEASELSPALKEYLAEYFLASRGFQQAHDTETFVIDKSGNFLAIIGLQDHLLLQWMDHGRELDKALVHLVQLENQIGKTIKYSFSSKFGYLTANPSRCGTGLEIRIFLHLPALVRGDLLDEALSSEQGKHIRVLSLQGEAESFVGDIVVLSNNQTLGVNEETTVNTLSRMATKLLVHEQGARKRIESENDAKYLDLVSRSYGLLKHSYQLEATEAFQELSLLKLGVAISWVKGIDMASLNELIFSCRRGHIIQREGELDLPSLAHKRAQYVQKALEKVSLNT